MKVWIKTLDADMQIKNNGIELEVRSPDDSRQIGDCVATSTGLTWCKGRTTRKNGVHVTWSDFMILCSSPDTLKAAIAAAKKA